jgi:hypothetical protein
MKEYELVGIEVGKEFPLYSETVEKLRGKDGVYFEASEIGQGYLLCIHYNNITNHEIETIRFGKARMRVVTSVEGFVLPLIKFGQHMIFELIFDPTLYEDARALQLSTSNNLITIIAIDSRTNIVKGLRQANLPLKMIQICSEYWAKAILEINFSERYKDWINHLQEKYTLEGLWNRGIDVGYLGESYDLNEIHYKQNI